MKQYILILLCIFFCSTTSLQAAEGPWLETEYAKVRLISSTLATGNLKIIPAALEFQLNPDWKVYWRSPGDAGLPPVLATENQQQEITNFWPVPERFSLFGVDTFGYSGRVLLPLSIKRFNTNTDFLFEGSLDALICSNICVPITGRISLFIPKGEAFPSSYAQEIAFAKARVPSETTGPNIKMLALGLNSKDKKILIEIEVPDENLDDIIIETNLKGFSFSKPFILEKANNRFLAEVNVNGMLNIDSLIGQELTLTLISGHEFKEIKSVLLNTGENLKLSGVLFSGISSILIISFIGGIILNLMPCVLPVLSLKVATFMGTANKSYSEVRNHFLATALGIIVSFFLLSLTLLVLRNIGYQVGWGIQFQNPIFLGIISIILILFISSLLDWFYLPIPKFAVTLSSFVSSKRSYLNDFLSGMLATILATPCSAPFVGTATAFALSGSNLILFSVLLIMGFGLAFPWLVFAAAPSLTSYIPNPGYWMIRIKQVSAILLIGTLIWILWVFSHVVGWRVGLENNSSGSYKQWSEEIMMEAIKTGQPVFVDVTADWCITCKLNKIAVLETKQVSEAFQKAGFILLQADWTNPSDEVAKFLVMHERFGIPFDIIFSPQLETPIILPEILTSKRLLSAIKEASIQQSM